MRVVAIFVAGLLTGCGSGPVATGNDLGVPRMDATVIDMKMPSSIGGPCAFASDCSEGAAPVCFTKTVFNHTGDIATPDGYCSSKCTSDSDCGADSYCVSEGSQGNWCFSSCKAPTDCRSGYACFITSGADHCFPSKGLQCDPTVGDGTCNPNIGTDERAACWRYAMGPGNTGYCVDGCQIGVGSCPPRSGAMRQCAVLDFTGDVDANNQRVGDKFKGAVCIYGYAANADGTECSYKASNGSTNDYIDACADGEECQLAGYFGTGDNLCHQLCIPGAVDGGVACSKGTCADVWGLFNSANPVGLCR